MPHPLRALAALAVPALALVPAGCTVPAEPSVAAGTEAAERQCFLPRQVNGFTAVGNDRVVVRISARRLYELDLVGTCPEVDWSNRIGIRSRGGSSWVCQGFDAELLVPGPTGLQQCPVTNVRRLSEAEVEAFRQRRRRP